MKQLQEEQDLATRAHDSAPGLFTRSEDVPDPRFRFFCVECGAEIHGVPYLTAWYSICVCLDPYDFCSEACWNKNDLLNSANWPPPANKRSTEKERGLAGLDTSVGYLYWLLRISVPNSSAHESCLGSISLPSKYEIGGMKVSCLTVSFLFLERICEVASTARRHGIWSWTPGMSKKEQRAGLSNKVLPLK